MVDFRKDGSLASGLEYLASGFVWASAIYFRTSNRWLLFCLCEGFKTRSVEFIKEDILLISPVLPSLMPNNGRVQKRSEARSGKEGLYLTMNDGD